MREETRSHRPVAELAKRQHGVVSAWQLAELGISKDVISRETAALDPRFLGGAVEAAKRLDLFEMPLIDALLKRSRGFRGVARLRNALEIYRDPAFTRSRLERRFLALVKRAGLSRPSMNFFVEGYELDAYWQTERFAVELDTYDYHGGHIAFEQDRLRQEDLKLAGIEMTRVTGVRMDREPEAVVARLRRLLAQRRRHLNREAQ